MQAAEALHVAQPHLQFSGLSFVWSSCSWQMPVAWLQAVHADWCPHSQWLFTAPVIFLSCPADSPARFCRSSVCECVLH